MKAKLNYTVRTTRAPGETRDSLVPVIVDRLSPVELESVVENCIDRGLIAGLKPTAAHGIAEGVAAQIAQEFSKGRGVKFGTYFYGRPYLSGTVDANGRLNADNSINVRLYKGESFKLSKDDYKLSFDGAGDAVKVDYVFSDAQGATRGTLFTGAGVIVQGRNLWAVGDTNRVIFDEVGGDDSVVVSAFTYQGDGLLTFAWPAALEAGKRYTLTVERTDANGVTRIATGKLVDVVAGATPVPTTPTVTAINGGGVFYAGDNRIEGTNIRFADAHPASHIVLKNGEGQAVTGVAFTDQGTASETEFHVIVADNEGTLADGADYTWEFAMVDSQGNPVTVTKTARWVSE